LLLQLEHLKTKRQSLEPHLHVTAPRARNKAPRRFTSKTLP
jgi:hypothetical protein